MESKTNLYIVGLMGSVLQNHNLEAKWKVKFQLWDLYAGKYSFSATLWIKAEIDFQVKLILY